MWTQSEKQRQANEYIAARALDFHDRFREGVKWFDRFFDHFQGPQSDVKFVLLPTDATFGKVDKLISNDLQDAVELLGGESRILDLRSQAKELDSSDFYDVQHLVGKGRIKLQPAFVAAVSNALGCIPGLSR